MTSHQRSIYEDAVYNDMSLSEIAQKYSISKQAVHDIIQRCTKSLEEYEDKLHMVRRSLEVRKLALELKDICKNGEDAGSQVRSRLEGIADKLIEEVDG